MTDNLKLELKANTDYIGSYNDGSTFTFNTGAACGTNEDCIMNSNTVMTENVSFGGYYYSWYAATAGKGNENSVGDVNGSICPKGWKLPYNYTFSIEKSYHNLLQKYLGVNYSSDSSYSTILQSLPLSFTLSNLYNTGKYQNTGTGGNGGTYWASTASNSSGISYYFYYSGSFTRAQWTNPMYYGYSVRCVSI